MRNFLQTAAERAAAASSPEKRQTLLLQLLVRYQIILLQFSLAALCLGNSDETIADLLRMQICRGGSCLCSV